MLFLDLSSPDSDGLDLRKCEHMGYYLARSSWNGLENGEGVYFVVMRM